MISRRLRQTGVGDVLGYRRREEDCPGEPTRIVRSQPAVVRCLRRQGGSRPPSVVEAHID
jgi:hypothetical protein